VGGAVQSTRAARDSEPGARERLLREATRIFAAKGYAATTVRDLLRAAGVTAPSLYYHFGNKEGVFLALVREGVQKFEASLGESLGEAESAAGRIRVYCRAIAAVRREHPELVRIVDAMLSDPADAAPQLDVRALVCERVRRLEGLVREGMRSGEFRKGDPLHATLALLAAVDMALRPRVLESVVPTAEGQLDGMLSVILGGLVAPGPYPSPKRRCGAAAHRRRR
jgi:TetR/AcrR family transcriptional regulator